MASSKIEWTEATWNPTTGCSKVSPGCKNCYAERMAKRLQAMGVDRYKNGFSVEWHEDTLDTPKNWKRPRMIFVNSMSDLFHESVPFEFIFKVFSVMNQCSQHTFQVLTKRSKRLAHLAPYLPWSRNIWMGVSVESDEYKFRIKDLASTSAHIKFLSLEPLIGPISRIPLREVDWVIVGGESGPKARKIKEDWVIKIKDRCIKFNIPFFFKQWGGTNKKKTGRILENKEWNEYPQCLSPE